MKVLIIRHSSAVDPYAAPSDELRWLTAAGRERMQSVAKLIGAKVTITQIYTSPLVRAVQTAEILGLGIGYGGEIQVHGGLASEYGTTAQALSVLEKHNDNDVIALVSHAPKVRVLAGHLSGERKLQGFTTAATCCVDTSTPKIDWFLDPT